MLGVKTKEPFPFSFERNGHKFRFTNIYIKHKKLMKNYSYKRNRR